MQLLFVAHKERPAGGYPILQATGGRFIADGHDDGWYLRLGYSSRPDIESLCNSIIARAWPRPDFESFWKGDSAYWLEAERFDVEERTEDIDRVQNRRGWTAP